MTINAIVISLSEVFNEYSRSSAPGNPVVYELMLEMLVTQRINARDSCKISTLYCYREPVNFPSGSSRLVKLRSLEVLMTQAISVVCRSLEE